MNNMAVKTTSYVTEQTKEKRSNMRIDALLQNVLFTAVTLYFFFCTLMVETDSTDFLTTCVVILYLVFLGAGFYKAFRGFRKIVLSVAHLVWVLGIYMLGFGFVFFFSGFNGIVEFTGKTITNFMSVLHDRWESYE